MSRLHTPLANAIASWIGEQMQDVIVLLSTLGDVAGAALGVALTFAVAIVVIAPIILIGLVESFGREGDA